MTSFWIRPWTCVCPSVRLSVHMVPRWDWGAGCFKTGHVILVSHCSEAFMLAASEIVFVSTDMCRNRIQAARIQCEARSRMNGPGLLLMFFCSWMGDQCTLPCSPRFHHKDDAKPEADPWEGQGSVGCWGRGYLLQPPPPTHTHTHTHPPLEEKVSKARGIFAFCV